MLIFFYYIFFSPRSVNQGSSDVTVLQVLDQVRRLGVDAELRDHRPQLTVVETAVHRVRQLCPQVSGSQVVGILCFWGQVA